MKRIIIADDSGMARTFIRRCLEIAGFREAEFLEAENGREVLALLREQAAELVVTDLNMPEMGGLELLKSIKASPRLFDTPVLVITSLTDPKRVQEIENLGALAILPKPVSPSSVAAALADYLNDEDED